MVPPKIRTPLYVLKFNRVPTDWALSDIIEALKSRVKSIVYIHRVADYNRTLLDKDIFLGLHDEVEYLALKEIGKIKIREIEIEMEFLGWEIASAQITTYESNREALPGVVRLIPLKEVFNVTTFYLLGLLKNLEAMSAAVVGIGVLYDTRLKKSRPFGFASFLTKLAAEVQLNTEFTVDGLKVRIEDANTVPIVVSSNNNVLIKRKPVKWTSEIKMANWLTSDIEMKDDEEAYQSDAESVLSLDFNEEILDI